MNIVNAKHIPKRALKVDTVENFERILEKDLCVDSRLFVKKVMEVHNYGKTAIIVQDNRIDTLLDEQLTLKD